MTKLCGVYSVSQRQSKDDEDDDDDVNPTVTTHLPNIEFHSFVYVLSTGRTTKNIRNKLLKTESLDNAILEI